MVEYFWQMCGECLGIDKGENRGRHIHVRGLSDDRNGCVACSKRKRANRLKDYKEIMKAHREFLDRNIKELVSCL